MDRLYRLVLAERGQQSMTGTVMRERLRSITVGQVMEPAPPVAAPDTTLAQLLSQYILPHNLRAMPVVQDGQLVGLITRGDIKDVPQDHWGRPPWAR